MARYGAVWVEIARDQYLALDLRTRALVDAALDGLQERPEAFRSAYDARTDQWTVIYGDGLGLIVYAVVHARKRIIVLRLV